MNSINPRVTALLLLCFGALVLAIALTGCNVTRTVTTTSTAYQRGDTSVVIQTKTTETYDGTLKH